MCKKELLMGPATPACPRRATRCDGAPPEDRSNTNDDHNSDEFVVMMSPPIVDWAPMDLVYGHNQHDNYHDDDAVLVRKSKALVWYHALTAGQHVLAPVGAATGLAAYYWMRHGASMNVVEPTSASLPKILPLVGTAAVMAGGIGSALGLYRQFQVIRHSNVGGKSSAAAAPWTDDEIVRRADLLTNNFPVRVMDLSVGVCGGLAMGVLIAKGGPAKVGLSPGVWGFVQAVGLGTTAGSLGGMACIYANRQR